MTALKEWLVETNSGPEISRQHFTMMLLRDISGKHFLPKIWSWLICSRPPSSCPHTVSTPYAQCLLQYLTWFKNLYQNTTILIRPLKKSLVLNISFGLLKAKTEHTRTCLHLQYLAKPAVSVWALQDWGAKHLLFEISCKPELCVINDFYETPSNPELYVINDSELCQVTTSPNHQNIMKLNTSGMQSTMNCSAEQSTINSWVFIFK